MSYTFLYDFLPADLQALPFNKEVVKLPRFQEAFPDYVDALTLLAIGSPTTRGESHGSLLTFLQVLRVFRTCPCTCPHGKAENSLTCFFSFQSFSFEFTKFRGDGPARERTGSLWTRELSFCVTLVHDVVDFDNSKSRGRMCVRETVSAVLELGLRAST
ncbi:hypothetical protein PAPYR_1151 [Paratrimastix pyriformis]|uniref:Uncharacterized protein n=1 Tax=Paratrimastix pyriformis TaxID=342808 RepID=A0ABQ8UVQ6_9EUKA|nr:hypothetical protein PAPYR_1151 [Paratrimastix pyriformis]